MNLEFQVRIAWFSMLNNMFEYDSGLLKCYSEEVSHVILPSLDDHEGAVLSHIWVAFLHLCIMYPVGDFFGFSFSHSVGILRKKSVRNQYVRSIPVAIGN